MIVAVLGLAACGSPTAPLYGATNGGSGVGLSTAGAFVLESQIAFERVSCDAGAFGTTCNVTPNDITLQLIDSTNDAGLCHTDATSAAHYLTLEINTEDQNQPIAVGQYSVVPSADGLSSNRVYLTVFENNVRVASGVSGQLNLTQITPSLVGEFTAELAAEDGGAISGSLSGGFDAGWCGSNGP
jgi:hypothetical protein